MIELQRLYNQFGKGKIELGDNHILSFLNGKNLEERKRRGNS